ncbi:hypothetical protein THAOC_01276 [Thalassiosira oceanica]|uniref:Pentacotripeptide-repeat region of PRORP domain-containing protein n=1 Tax=Thalassiosira oceanica TaxID=159749 RepID=K0TQZ9_THAOC|nr:hypothetical protein THAOC_01276 [Thalassiosira oceanica]|eukprot:EJK76927.1 hypothetical protein THAOC_01276 [Thalassiosira oceanica]
MRRITSTTPLVGTWRHSFAKPATRRTSGPASSSVGGGPASRAARAPPACFVDHPLAGGRRLLSSPSSAKLYDETLQKYGSAVCGYEAAAPSSEQKHLLEYTERLLPTQRDQRQPPGTLQLNQLADVSGCLEKWILTGDRFGAEQAAKLVKRLISEKGHGNDLVAWDMFRMEPFVALMSSVYTGDDFVEHMMSIVLLMEEEYRLFNIESKHSSEMPYKSLVAILCKCPAPHAATAAEHILHNFEVKLMESSIEHTNLPTIESYHNIMSAWKESNCVSYPSSVSPPYFHHPNPQANILAQLRKLYESNPELYERIRPDFLTYNNAISGLSRYGFSFPDERGVGKLCNENLSSMVSEYELGHERCAPDLITFSSVISILGRMNDGGDDELACSLFDKMLRISGVVTPTSGESSRPYLFDVIPRCRHLNIILSLLCKRRHVDEEVFDRANRYVALMDACHERSLLVDLPQTYQVKSSYFDEITPRQDPANDEFKPDLITYNTLIHIAARAGLARKSEDILDDMLERSKVDEFAVKPDSTTFNTVLLAWSKSRGANREVTRLLEKMQALSDEGLIDARPDRTSLTIAMNAITPLAHKNRNAPIQAENIIARMVQNRDPEMRPDKVAYSSLIKCWIKSGRPKAADRAEEVIDILHQKYLEGKQECKPDATVYNIAMDALAKSRVKNAGQRAERLLNRMQACYEAGDEDLAPTTESFSTVMSAWARSGGEKGAKVAETLLAKMHELERSGLANVSPNTISYSTCIMAWRNSKQPDAGERADRLLEKMERLEADGCVRVKPNVITYTNAMEAWINSAQPNSLERVEAILEHMIERAKKGDDKSSPTAITFNVVLKAVRYSDIPDKHIKAQQIINRMKSMDGQMKVKPVTTTYNAFFSACVETKGDAIKRKAAFSLVLEALTEMQSERISPDSYTYPAIWAACAQLLDMESDLAVINRVFELTAKSGMVDRLLFNNLRRYLPAKYLARKIGTEADVKGLTVKDLPKEWTSNVNLGRNRSFKHSKRKSINTTKS